MTPASVEDALYQLGDQVGEVAAAINNRPESGFNYRDEIILKVIQGVCSREDFTGITPSFIADFAVQVADAVTQRTAVKRV